MRIGQKMCNHHLPAHDFATALLRSNPLCSTSPLHTSVAGQRPYKWLVVVTVNSQVSLTAQRDA